MDQSVGLVALVVRDYDDAIEFYIDRAGGCSYFVIPTTLRATTACLARGASSLCGSPGVESYGTVAVFKDLYGNLWDLIGSAARD